MPYGAAKFGGKCARSLFDGRGSFYLNETGRGPDRKITPAMLRQAGRRLRQEIERHRRLKAENIKKTT